jgi:arylsulfatase A-like enzyme
MHAKIPSGLKHIIPGIAALSPLMAHPPAAAGAGRPNILVIMTDDQGAGDVGYNNPLVRTPALDSIARDGARFDRFIAAPACAPSRAAFLTGRNHYHAGVWGVGPRAFVNRDEVYIPEYLRRAGYRTAHFGKWDERAPDMRAHLRGYDEAGCLDGGYQHRDPLMIFNGRAERREGWTSDILADLTIDFIKRRQAAGGPWFAVTAYIAPHSPWVSASEFSAPLEKKGYSKPLAELYGMIGQMDRATGRILRALEETGAADSTLVIYVSDNGATPVCPRTGGTPEDGPDWAKRNPLQLRGRKSYLWENGIRVPCAMRWPGKIVSGARAQLGAMEDMLPTLLDVAGIPDSIVPNHLQFHGRSLKPVLFDKNAPEEERMYFRLPIAGKGMPLPEEEDPVGIIDNPRRLDYRNIHTVIYGPRFKYHHLAGGGELLYEMTNAAREEKNMAREFPDITRIYGERCRMEWDAVAGGERRTLTMPYFLVGDPRHAGVLRIGKQRLPADTVAGDAPLSVGGTVRSPYGAKGATGFTTAGDHASFGIEVVTPGDYLVRVTGMNLETAGLVLRIENRDYKPLTVAGDALDFGTIRLPAGRHELRLTSVAPAPGAEKAVILEIQFR